MNAPQAPSQPATPATVGAASAPPPSRPLLPHHVLAYAISLPERAVREVAAIAGGFAYLASFLVPRPLREGKFFRLAVRRQIKLLADDLGQAGLFPSQKALDRRTAVRMGIGGTVDNLLILSLHASPLWILFAATDVAGGAHAFLREVGDELRMAGVMRPGSRLDSVEDVLEGLASLSDRVSDSLDMPPISLTDMKATVNTLKSEIANVTETTAHVANLEGLAQEVRELARSSRRSLLETTSAIATGAMRTTGNLITGTAVGTTATMRFVGRRLHEILDDYARSIGSIRELGFSGALARFLAPYARAQRRLFAYRFLTGTEILLSLGRWRKAAWRL